LFPKSIAKIKGAGAGHVLSPLGLALCSRRIFKAAKFEFPAAQLIGFP